MFDYILKVIAPHLCCSCREIGAILCHRCLENISNHSERYCLVCERPNGTGVCSPCQPALSPITQAWAVGLRTGPLKALIDAFKFERCYEAHRPLAQLLHKVLPPLPEDTCIVPIPTIAAHIRQRGYDHCALIARDLAQARSLPYASLLSRATTTVQHTASKNTRQQQAAMAFTVARPLAAKRYLLVDDITTTGATLRAAAALLKKAGAGEVWAVVVAKQPLDE